MYVCMYVCTLQSQTPNESIATGWNKLTRLKFGLCSRSGQNTLAPVQLSVSTHLGTLLVWEGLKYSAALQVYSSEIKKKAMDLFVSPLSLVLTGSIYHHLFRLRAKGAACTR